MTDERTPTRLPQPPTPPLPDAPAGKPPWHRGTPPLPYDKARPTHVAGEDPGKWPVLLAMQGSRRLRNHGGK